MKTTVLRQLTFIAVLVMTGATAHAQKNINFDAGGGSVSSTLVFNNNISPDVYSFFANAGEQIRVQTSNNGTDPANRLDTTIRVIGPNAATSLFDDDGGGNLASRLVFTAERTGQYIVVVSTFSGNPVRIPGNNGNNGDYILTLARGAAAASPRVAAVDDPDSGGQSQQGGSDTPIEKKE